MKNALRSWKTTLGGVGILLTTGADIAHDPSKITIQQLTQLLAGVSLILAKDGSVTGTTSQPRY